MELDLRFIQERQGDWERLSHLLDRSRRSGLKGLSGSEILELGRLYRRTAGDLAYARTHLPDEELRRRLNELLSRAHGTVDIAEKGGVQGLLSFFQSEWPDLLATNRSFIGAATAAFLLGWLLILARPDLAAFVAPEAYRTPRIDPADSPVSASFITQNNIQVALRAFAAGVAFGIPTLVLLFINGMMLGGVSVLIARQGESLRFWPSIVPHGILELTSIMVAGGAGLRMGWSLIHPGDLPRGRALTRAGAEAIRLVTGTIPMFIVAGVIEGFISFSSLPAALKLFVAALSAMALVLYLRRKRPTAFPGKPVPTGRKENDRWSY